MEMTNDLLYQVLPIVCIVAAVGILVGTRVWIMFK